MGVSDRSQREKRDFIRIKIDAPLPATLELDGRTLEGYCQDLSGSGVSLSLDEALPNGTEATITIEGQTGHRPTLRAHTRVVRVSAEPDGKHTLGLELLDILD